MDLWQLFGICLKRWWLFALVMLAFGAAGFFGTRMLIPATYESTVKLYVNNQDLSIGNVSISTSDLSASVQLVDVYEVILSTKDTLDLVIEQAGLSYDYVQLKSMLSTSSVNSTQIFKVTVTSTSPKEAQLIASTIGDVLPDVIANIIESADARIVEHAIVPTQQSGPHYAKNAVMAAFVGFMLVLVFVCYCAITDVSIRSEQDLLDEIGDLPVLTHVPDFNSKLKKADRYSKNYYYQEKQ